MPADRVAARERLDVVLVRRGLAPSRTQAQALVLAGQVRSGGQRLDKPGLRVAPEVPLEVLEGPRWVSRGGAKLEAALSRLSVEVAGRDAIDVGASTGGFTQVLLEAGAPRVVALDVGRGQLDWKLRRDTRVRVLEGFNARHLRLDALPWKPSLAVVDVSFISLRLVLPPLAACLAEPGDIVALLKPQFEVGRGQVGRGGIVREYALHREVLERMARFVEKCGWGLAGLCASALRGAQGNQEYFLHIVPSAPGLDGARIDRRIRETVSAAEDQR